MMSESDKLRADARGNRDRILEVARAALAADPGAMLNSIAKSAGVGQGTLYRHFATREALVLSVYRKEIDDLIELAPTLLLQHQPLEAFRLWCSELARLGRVKHGIADALHAVVSEQDFEQTYVPIVGAVRLMMEACEAAGQIRSGIQPADFLMLLQFLWQTPPTSDSMAQTQRLLELSFRSLGSKD
jgi:AcrR family transcriptional regulator